MIEMDGLKISAGFSGLRKCVNFSHRPDQRPGLYPVSWYTGVWRDVTSGKPMADRVTFLYTFLRDDIL